MSEQAYVEREVEKNVLEWLDAREIIAIRGPRQGGKTTLLERIIGVLESKGVGKERVHFVSMEDDEERARFEKAPKQVVEYYAGESSEKHFFLFDEIQCVKKAGKIMKVLFDSHKNAKFVITGSSALDLNEMSSHLVGRILFFELYPFSFNEFLKTRDERLASVQRQVSNSFEEVLKGEKKEADSTVYLDKLNEYLKEYAVYGGYPRVCLEKNVEKKKFLLKNLVQTYIEKDVVKIYGIKHSDELLALLKMLSGMTAKIVNYNTITGILPINYRELKRMLSVLQTTYIIRLVQPFHENMVTELRKNPKAYFIDNGLRNYLAGRFEFNELEMGNLYENYAFNCIKGLNPKFWRTAAKAEVDFILPDSKTPIEVKSSKQAITRSMKSFIDTYKPQKAFIANLEKNASEKIGETIIYWHPLSCLPSMAK